MPQAVSSDLYLYADDSCLVYQHKDAKVIEQQLNKDFFNLSDWFVDNKLSIHFGEDKTKSLFFSTKNKIKRAGPLNIKNVPLICRIFMTMLVKTVYAQEIPT